MNEQAAGFLQEYEKSNDTFCATFPRVSLKNWTLSQADQEKLLLALSNARDNEFQINVTFELYRSLKNGSVPHKWSTAINLTANKAKKLGEMINSTSTTVKPVFFDFSLPPYLIVPKQGDLHGAEPLLNGKQISCSQL